MSGDAGSQASDAGDRSTTDGSVSVSVGDAGDAGGDSGCDLDAASDAPVATTDGWMPAVAAPRNLSSTNTWENTVLTIPPEAAGCGPNGAVFVGKNPILQRNTLTCQVDGTGCNPTTIDFNTTACDPNVSPQLYASPAGYDDRPCEMSDGSIIRLKTGHLLFNLGVVRYQPAQPSGRRGMHVFMDSGDCGATWTIKKRFDPVEIGLLDFSRGLIYGDPWSDSVYFTVQDLGGLSYLFRSIDGGATWAPQLNAAGSLPFAGDGWRLTTLQNQVVFLFGCPDGSGSPTVVRWDPIAQQSHTYSLPGACQTLSALGSDGSPNISRVGAYVDGEYVRVMWPDVENGSQVLRATSLAFGPDHSLSEGPVNTLRASASGGSLFSVTSIEADRFELDPASSASVAFLHWYETTATPPAGGTDFGSISAKGGAVRDRDNWSNIVTLSTASWPIFSKPGDYARSGFWYEPSTHQLNFLPHWAENPSSTSALQRSAVVSINREQSFTTFESIGGTATAAPSVSSPYAGRLDVYARGSEHDIWHQWKDGSAWSGWEDLGAPPGGANGSPASVDWGGGRDDIFVLGTDNHLWHKSYDPSFDWSNWEDLGGPFASDPSVTSWGPGHVDFFIRGTDGSTMHQAYDWAYGYTGWHSLGGSSIAAPTGASWKSSGSATGRVDVFALGGDNVLYQKSCLGACKTASDFGSEWTSVGGNFVTGGAAAWFDENRLDLFGRGRDNRIYHKAWDSSSGWSGWLTVPGSDSSASRPAVVIRQPDMDLLELGPDNAIWHAHALP